MFEQLLPRSEVRGSRTEETAQDWCSASRRWKNSASRVVQVADDSQSNHVEPNRQEQHRRRLELRGTQWLAHGHVSRLTGQSIVASIETGQLEHGHETVLELVGQLLLQGRRANLASGAAGLFVLTGERLR